MTIGYQMESSHIVDYHLYTLPGLDYTLRGPYVPCDGNAPSVSFLGAAQTFGAFCKYPFPNILCEMVSANPLNLAQGGAGPDFYLNRPKVFEYVNKTNCCIVQIMSARSSNNSYMRVLGGGARVELTAGSHKGEKMLGHRALEKLYNELSPEQFFKVVEESQAYFFKQMVTIAKKIRVPKILLFVGKKGPLSQFTVEGTWSLPDLIGTHPHMVTETMLEKLSAHFDSTVAVYGTKGIEMELINRFTGDFASVNRGPKEMIKTQKVYIPPHLHTKTALELYDPVLEILRGR